MRKLLALAWLLLLGATPLVPNWKNTNPGAGGAWNLLMETPYAMFAGGDVGGLWRSTNRGRSWTEEGKLNGGVKLNRTSVTAMDYDPRTDSLVFYAACEGRLLRSVDGGMTFHATVIDSGTATDAGDTPTDWIASVAVCKQRPDNVYAVWHAGFNDTSLFTLGPPAAYPMVKKSTDRGLTWSNTLLGGNFAIGNRLLKILVDPSAPTLCYLLTGGDRFTQPDASGRDWRTNMNRWRLYRSLNSGNTWTDITPPTGSEAALDVMMHPYDSDTIYATTWTGTLDGTHSGHTWVSFNEGTTWQAALSAHTGSLAYRTVATPAATLRSQIKVYVVNPTLDRTGSCAECGVWWSASPWTTWTRFSDGLDWNLGWIAVNANGSDGATAASSRGFCATIATSEADTASFMWASGQHLHRFTASDSTVRSLGVDSLLAGPALQRSHWFHGRGADNTIVMALAGAGQWLYSGAWDIGIWRSQDRGDSWQPTNDVAMTNQASGWYGMGGDCSTILADPTGNGHVWAGQGTGKHKANMTRSVKSGEPGSWAAVGGGVADSLLYGLSLDLKSAPGNRTLYCTSMGDVCRSLDDGVTWTYIVDHTTASNLRGYDPAPGTPTARDTSAFWCTAVTLNGNLWIGGGAHLMKSTNPTAVSPTFVDRTPITWATAAGAGSNFDFRYRGVHDLLARPEGLYVTLGGVGVARGAATAADSFGVYFTPDEGASWYKLHTGTFDDRFVVGPNGEWWVGSRSVGAGGGITVGQGLKQSRSRLMTTPSGWTAAQSTQWADVTGTLPWPSFGPLFVDPQGSYVMVGIPGGAFYRTDTPTSGAFAP